MTGRLILTGMSVVFMSWGCSSPEPAVRYRYRGSIDDTRAFSTLNAYRTSPADEPTAPSGFLPDKPVPRRTVQPATSASTAFAEIDPGPSDLTIQQDSLIQVKVEEDPALDGSYPVNEIGAIELGYVGPVVLLNMTESVAEGKVSEILESRFFQKAHVSVKIVRASYDRVKVEGGVGRPGVIKIGAGDRISLNDVLIRAGGLRSSAKGTSIRIVRGGLTMAIPPKDSEDFSLVDDDGNPSIPDVYLRNNDVVYVSSSDSGAPGEVGEKEIYVFGEVNKQGTYRFSAGEPCTIMHLILDKMGGLPAWANKKKVKIIRRGADGFEEEIIINAEDILEEGDPDRDVPLESGDRVVVPARRISIF